MTPLPSFGPQKPHPAPRIPRLLSGLAVALLGGCAQLPSLPFGGTDDAAVVYALGGRQGFTSPLNASLKPVVPALQFNDSRITLNSQQERVLLGLASDWEKDRQIRYLVAAYAPPGIPEDHARSLSERRALGVRQRLIELGVEGTSVHAIGFGNDFATTSPTSHVVNIYRQ
ncbi:MAG: hypothetical protein HS117_27265 [Verrucomicrobiaceae bacterium]|jgi:hypothetical protein|nr:hypothetical protein [Verrucomicrobiaceae bacterium]